MAKLTSNVWVDGTWYGPDYPDAGDPPEGSVDQRAYEGDEGEQPRSADDLRSVSEPSAPIIDPPAEYVVDPPAQTAQDEPPPKAGRGSGRDAWVAYADAHGVQVSDEDGRDDVIAALEAAGVRTD